MNTNPQQYPTRFYGRTWIYWVGVLVVGSLATLGCILGPLFCFDVINLGNGDPGFLPGIPMVMVSLPLMPFAIAFVVQVITRQLPTLIIYQEGIWIRVVETPIQDYPVLQVLQLAMFQIVFVMFWRLITGQMFQTPTYRLRWENIETIWTETGTFAITGWIDKDRFDFEQDAPLKYLTISCTVDSFGTPIRKVNESVQFFLHNPDAREFLPSWQDEETMLERTTILSGLLWIFCILCF